jgi:hypothetical protein
MQYGGKVMTCNMKNWYPEEYSFNLSVVAIGKDDKP